MSKDRFGNDPAPNTPDHPQLAPSTSDPPLRTAQLLYLGTAEAEWGTTVSLAAQLTDDSGVPLSGREVRFRVAGGDAVTSTDAWGMARVQQLADQPPGDVTVTAAFAGDAEHASAEVAVTLTLHRVATRLALSVASALPVGAAQPARAVLTRIDGAPLAGMAIAFHTDDGVHTSVTDATGMASVATASAVVAAVFAGDDGHAPADAKAATLRFAPTGFVVWGGNTPGLALGAQLTFWGPSWAAQVTGGDYAAGNDFKGWAETSSFSLCQPTAHTTGAPRLTPGCWSSRSGWTSPPTSLAEYIGVLVTSAVGKSQGRIYGNVAALAVLRVDEAPRRISPGTAARGTLVGIVQGGALFAEPPAIAAELTQPATVAPGQAFEAAVALSNPSLPPADDVVVDAVFTGGIAPAEAEVTVGRLAPGEQRSVALAQRAPTVEARRDDESAAAYEQRLAACDGRPLAAIVEVRLTDAYQRVLSPLPLYAASRLVLPRLLVSLSGPAQVAPGESVRYALAVRNAGSAAATSGTARVVLPDGGAVALELAALAPGAMFQTEVPWTVPALPARDPGESAADYAARIQALNDQIVTAAAMLTWRDGASEYGPVSQQVSATLHVQTPPASELPPDPASVAPPLPQTHIAPFADSVAFLYTGDRPIQVDVDPAALDARRLAVLRGKVSGRDGMPISGVAITMAGHPEYGKTLTREDGMFDIAVNGGGQITVQYDKAGYLGCQRHVVAPWRDYAWLPEVVLIAPDAKASLVDLTAAAEVQIAQGSPSTDGDGTRTATLLFAPGTQATMTLPDGSTQPLTAITVRATEYTTGANGPSCMPATLPATSAYTYAVNLQVDEAARAGATRVQFSQPVAFYVENFVGFPVGTAVPVGYHDAGDGTWKPEDDGKVIAIVGIADGVAQLDTGGDGRPDAETSLAALGITLAERRTLARLYPAGTSLWRVAVHHFSDHDFNWGAWPPPDACAPSITLASSQQPENDPDTLCGCIIEAQNQTLGETLPITGAGFPLHYSSDRAAGRTAGRTLRIPLSGPTLPPSVKRIVVEISIAGRQFSFTRPPLPDQVLEVTWDGKDAYGRTVQGEVIAVGRTGYVYGLAYLPPPDLRRTFALLSATPNTLSPARDSATLWQPWTAPVGGWGAPTAQLGGWSLGIHHAYNPNSEVLYPGTGGRRSVTGLGPVIHTVVGPEVLGAATDVAVAPDGSVYIVDSSNRIHRLAPDGTTSLVAGNGQRGNDGDGGPAIEASLQEPHAVAVGPDGSIYVADTFNFRVRRIRPDGIITAFAGFVGSGAYGYGGDGGPAVNAQFRRPVGLAVAPDGCVYIADADTNHVRRVAPDGTISTFVGSGGRRDSTGDGGPAVKATFNALRGLACGPDGSIYIVDQGAECVRRVGPDGIISAFAGKRNQTGFDGDGGLAVEAKLAGINRVAVSRDGSVYLADTWNNRIRRVDPDGIITTFAGTNAFAFGGDGGLARDAQFKSCASVAVAPNGSVYVCDGSQRVRRIDTALSGTGASLTETLIPSANGAEIYVFDRHGQHLRTLDALTRTLRHEFRYDANGRLSAIEHRHGLVTRVDRDAAGLPTAIVAPHGQCTAFTLDDHGYLASVTNPAGERTSLTYTSTGLLTSVTNATGELDVHEYGDLGRFTRDAGPGCSSKRLTRVEHDGDYTVAVARGSGRTTTYRVQRLTGDRQLRTKTSPDGLETRTAIEGGTTSVTTPDGTVTTVTQGPDVRFGMHAPIDQARTVRLPSGLTASATHTQNSTLIAGSDNPLDIATLTNTVTVNGNTFTATYTAATRQQTSRTAHGRVITTAFDEEGRLARVAAPHILPCDYHYDDEGRLQSITQGARTLSLAYDAQGTLAAYSDPIAGTTRFERDPAGRVTRITLPGERRVDVAYNATGAPIALTPPGRPAHRFSYLPDGSIERYTPPPPSPEDAALPTSYRYDVDMALAAIELPDGNEIAISRDGAGRIAAITTPRTTVSVSYDPQGRFAQLQDPAGASLAFEHDGALVTRVAWTGGVAGNVEYAYTPDFLPASVAVNGQAIAYQYERGLLRSAGALAIQRVANDDVLAGTSLGKITTAQSYDDFGQLKTLSASLSGSALYSLTLGRDAGGRIVRKTETALGVTRVWDYGFDAAGRLQTVLLGGAPYASYAYDANGNRTSMTREGVTQLATYDDQDRLVTQGDATYTFGPNGDLQRIQRAGDAAATELGYDARGALISVRRSDGTRIDYVIDAAGRRVGKTVDGVRVQGFLYDGRLRVIAELDAQGQIASRFVYGTRAHVPDYLIKGDATYRIVTDHLGSVRLVVHAQSGSVAQVLEHGPGGEVLADSNPGFQPFGFAGGIHDVDSKLVRFGARDYHAEAGRWTAKDPILLRGGTNVYAYVHDDPINRIDPSGLFEVFGYYSLGTHTPAPGVALGAEDVEVFGYDTHSSFYRAEIIAAEFKLGGEANYAAVFGGEELVTDGSVEDIILAEGGIGIEDGEDGAGVCAGAFEVGPDAHGRRAQGVYFGVAGGILGEHGSLGFGFTLPNLAPLWDQLRNEVSSKLGIPLLF